MSMYTTAQLLAANEQKFKFDPLFLRLFFRESYPFTTEKVYLSQIPGLVNMALYVSPIVSGEVIRSRGGSTSEFTPGYVKPKHEVNPQMTLRRLPDEDPQNLADPAYRRRRIIMQNMRDEEGNTNISGVTVVFRAGEQEQTPPEGFESSGSETVLGTEVKYDTPITRTITSANIDRLRFTFGVQALVETTSKGDRNPSEVRLLVQIQRNGGWVTEKDITIKGKTTSQYLASVVVGNLPPRPFNIRMRRMTPDSTTDQLQNKTLWSSYTEIIDVKQCYPNTALVGVQVDSEQFGSQQVSRNYHLRGRILQVPSNYNPQTRQYSGIWDGTFKPAYSNNMAWCLWDMLTHPRYGMGKRLGAADVDKWALYVIGHYCDQSVPDGFGGTEPRITCNAYLTTQRKAWDVLSDFCSAMRCIPFNDSLDMITGFSPSYKKIVIGDDEITMPGDKVVKFKRASTATYINKSGVFSVAKIDEPRFEKEGLLIEGQRTNYFVKSNTPAEWTSTSNIDKTNNGVDEFGFSYAKMRTKDNMTGQSSALSLHTCSASRGIDVSGDNKYCTVSCRVKAPDGLRCRLRFEKYDGSVYTFLGDAYLTFGTLIIEKTGGAANRIAATATKDPVTGWIFYEATIEAVEGETLIGAMIQYAPKKGGITEAGDYIYLATPQFENGGCASSFVITTTAPATRSSDMVTIPTENNIYNRPLTCLVEVNRNWGDIPPNVAPRIFDFSGVPPIESITYAFNTTEKYYGQLYMQTYKASTSTYVSSVFAGRTDVRKFIGGFNIYSDGTKRVVSNGEATKTMKTEWTGVKTRTFIRIGGQATSGTRHLFGHLRNLRLWHKELTDAQMGESIK